MKRFVWILIAIVVLPAAAAAQALPDNPEPGPSGTASWSRVQDLADGEGITVRQPGSISVPCRFSSATRDDLFCDSTFSARSYRFKRGGVASVRADDRRRNVAILMSTFVAAGFVCGAAAPRSAGDTTPRALVGLVGAGFGAVAGVVVGVPASFLIPGRLVYRRPRADRKARSADASGATSAAQMPGQSSAEKLVP